MTDPPLAPNPQVLLEGGSALFVICDNLVIRYANPAIALALGWESATEPAESLITGLLHPADRPLLAGLIRELPAGGRSRQRQIRLRHTDGAGDHCRGGPRHDAR